MTHAEDAAPGEVDASEALPELVSSEHVADLAYLRITNDTVRFPDGSEAKRVSVWHPGAVALVAIDQDGRWLMVRQYRHAAGRILTEIPAGTREDGEAPEVTAARELREETGYAAGKLVHLGGSWMVPGYASEYLHYFLATDLRHDPLDQDEDEHLSAPVRMTLEELEAAIDRGDVQDAKTLTAYTLYHRHLAR